MHSEKEKKSNDKYLLLGNANDSMSLSCANNWVSGHVACADSESGDRETNDLCRLKQ